MAENERFAPRRELGRTGFVATALGIGDLADRSVPVETCVATARRALDAGLNVIDTAPNYEGGYSEEIVGRAVQERSRDAVFVIDKIDHHDAPVGLQVPTSVTLTVVDTAPEMKGSSATKRNKPARLNTGVEIQVPEYISNDEKVWVNTLTGEFAGRA